MKLRWLRTFWIVVGFVACATGIASAAEPVFLGYGTNPKWSPSGNQISIVTEGGFDIYRVDPPSKICSVRSPAPWHYYWYNEDTLAVYFKEYTKSNKPKNQFPIGINSILSLSGELTEISRDTAFMPRTYITPWKKLPSGDIGFFRVIDGGP